VKHSELLAPPSHEAKVYIGVNYKMKCCGDLPHSFCLKKKVYIGVESIDVSPEDLKKLFESVGEALDVSTA
jgi:hypothetical protein